MLNKIILGMVVLTLFGCGGDGEWISFNSSMAGFAANVKSATIDTSEFKGGQLRILGQCRPDGEILLVLPADESDDRIIGSPKCFHGKYAVRTATFGRPPCEVIVEYGGNQIIQAKVEGADFYCP